MSETRATVRMDSDTHASLYRIMTWLSPSFPVGAYSYSHGLEFAVESGLVRSPCQLTEWVETVICHGTGRADGIMVAEAHRAARQRDMESLIHVAELTDACRATSELALESGAQGRAFVAAATSDWSDELLDRLGAELEDRRVDLCHAVAVGAVAALRGVPVEATVCGYLQAFAANLVSAGVRLIPLGQTDAVRALEHLEKPVLATTHDVLSGSLDDIGTATPMVDLMSSLHETQYSRLFRS